MLQASTTFPVETALAKNPSKCFHLGPFSCFYNQFQNVIFLFLQITRSIIQLICQDHIWRNHYYLFSILFSVTFFFFFLLCFLTRIYEFLSVDDGGVTYICQNLPEKRGIIQKFVLNLLNWISAKKILIYLFNLKAFTHLLSSRFRLLFSTYYLATHFFFFLFFPFIR